MTQNQIAYHNAKELERHNIASEEETSRHQKVQEALTKWQTAVNKWQVAVNNLHYARMDAETERANRAREEISQRANAETERANRAREAQNLLSIQESMRSNVMNESIKEKTNAIQSAQVAETSRHQKAMESIQDRLNSSVIELNTAKSVESGAVTGLTQARTTTESYMPNKIVNEIDLTSSSANLNRARTSTEGFRQFEITTSAIRNIFDTGVDVFKAISGVPGISGSGSNSQSFFDQAKKLLNY